MGVSQVSSALHVGRAATAAPPLVLKFGGTALGSPARMRRAVRRVEAYARRGHRVVVVASAMGHRTDQILRWAGEVCGDQSRDPEVGAVGQAGEDRRLARRQHGGAAQCHLPPGAALGAAGPLVLRAGAGGTSVHGHSPALIGAAQAGKGAARADRAVRRGPRSARGDRTVAGGSREYLARLLADFAGRMRGSS